MKKVLGLCAMLFCATPALAAPTAQVGFSPEGTAETLVLSVIDSAKSEIRMMAYSFTAQDVVAALVRAKERGVNVALVLDERGNRDNYSQRAIHRLREAGIPVRLDSVYAIQHDKVIITDGRNVETGSFNFTHAAEHKNSENAVVIWDMPSLAGAFLDHWKIRWNNGHDA